jgi:hypothetical protein
LRQWWVPNGGYPLAPWWVPNGGSIPVLTYSPGVGLSQFVARFPAKSCFVGGSWSQAGPVLWSWGVCGTPFSLCGPHPCGYGCLGGWGCSLAFFGKGESDRFTSLIGRPLRFEIPASTHKVHREHVCSEGGTCGSSFRFASLQEEAMPLSTVHNIVKQSVLSTCATAAVSIAE